MTTYFQRFLAALFLLCSPLAAQAQGSIVQVPTREGVTTTLYWEAKPGASASASATVLLFPGAGGGFGKLKDGRPSSVNFLVRTVPQMLAQGFNVAIFGLPSDTEGLGYPDRITSIHMTDVRKVVEFIKTKADAPVWLVGTSRGTISAAAAAIQLQKNIAGVVLTSPIGNDSFSGALPKQDLAAIQVPVLLMNHTQDACKASPPDEVPKILEGLTQAPIKKHLTVSDGGPPRGDACSAYHWHGFIGIEKEAVDLIANWIKAPSN